MKKLLLLPAIIFLIIFLFAHLPAFAAPIGNYLVLNGGYVKTSNNNSSIPTSFSFSASIYPNSISGKQIILSIGDKNSSKRYYEIGIDGGLLFVDYGYNGFNSQISTSGLSSGSWQDIRVEITTTQTKLYINGELVLPLVITNTLGPIGPNIVLGDSYKETFFDKKPFKGLIDEVNIMNGSTNILQWHLDAARGVTTANDSSGNNLNGTLIGGDSLIHFYGVPPTPTPFVFQPIQWQRPVLPTLSFPFPTISNPFPTSFQPSRDSLAPTPGIREIPRPTRTSRAF